MVSPKQISQAAKINSVEYPRSWYPLCLSKEVRRKKTLKVRAFGREWVAFRNDKNEVSVMQRYCPHMGADLSRGKVENGLICPLHNRRFPESSCTAERGGLPVNAECMEHSGIVYVFLGEHEGQPIPGVLKSGVMSFMRTYDYPAPFQMVGLNGFDIHHLDTVHKRQLKGKPEMEVLDDIGIRINYKAEIAGSHFRDRMLRLLKIDSVDININCYAGSILIFDHKKINAQTLLSLLPVEKNKTRIFLRTVLLDKKPGIISNLMATLVQLSIIRFLKQDFHPLWDSQFNPEGMMLPEDYCAIEWYKHYQAIPKVSVSVESN